MATRQTAAPAAMTARETRRAPRLSPYGAGAAMIALGLLYFVLNGSLLIPAFAVAILLSYATDLRIPSVPAYRLLARVALYTLVYLANQEDPRNTDYLVGPASLRAFIGNIYAAEMTIQVWRDRKDDAHMEMPVVFCSGLVYLTACNTFEDGIVRIVTPIYMTFVALSFRSYRKRWGPIIIEAEGRRRPQRRRLAPTLLRVVAFALPLALGFVGQSVVRANRSALNDLANFNLRSRSFFDGLGMSMQPQLGSTFNLRGSPARVLRIKNLGRDDHLRGAAFDTYEDGHWGPALHERKMSPAPPARLTKMQPQPGAPRLQDVSTVELTRLVNDTRFLFLPLGSASVEMEISEGVEWSPEHGGPLRARGRAPFKYFATVSTTPDYQGPLATPRPLTAEQRERLLTISLKDDEADRLRAIAREATAGAKTDREKARAVVQYLIANHRYSLSTTVGPGDPVVSFLEKKKDAHCEFFAASAALLLRCVGVPTRYVTGYLAHERLPSGEVIVRQRDAHAWTEVWIDGTGWTYIDATPGDGRPDHEPDDIAAWRRGMEWFQDRVQALRDLLSNLPTWLLNLIIGGVAFLPIVYLALRSYFAKRRQAAESDRSPFAYTAAPPDLLTLSRRFESVLARAGAPFPEERTWGEHLSALAAAEREDEPSSSPPRISGTLIEAALDFARAFEHARFRGEDGPETRARLQSLLEKTETEIRTPPA